LHHRALKLLFYESIHENIKYTGQSVIDNKNNREKKDSKKVHRK